MDWEKYQLFFTPEEFACKCGCGRADMDEQFLDILLVARNKAGVAFGINSGFRCPDHNRNIGSTSINHTSGKAADISARTGLVRARVLAGLYHAGFRRIGISFHPGAEFVHCDSRWPEAPESCWTYPARRSF